MLPQETFLRELQALGINTGGPVGGGGGGRGRHKVTINFTTLPSLLSK